MVRARWIGIGLGLGGQVDEGSAVDLSTLIANPRLCRMFLESLRPGIENTPQICHSPISLSVDIPLRSCRASCHKKRRKYPLVLGVDVCSAIKQ